MQNWVQITTDPWVLEQIQGHKLELINTPYQRKVPEAPHLSRVKEQQLAMEIDKLLAKRAVSLTTTTPLGKGFISRVFLVPKKDGTMRPVIIDLRELNKFVLSEHFKMERIDLMMQEDWMVKLD